MRRAADTLTQACARPHVWGKRRPCRRWRRRQRPPQHCPAPSPPPPPRPLQVFRAQFHTMCASIGVDPLASNKGMWAEVLGFGDFYYELGVQVRAWAACGAQEGGGRGGMPP